MFKVFVTTLFFWLFIFQNGLAQDIDLQKCEDLVESIYPTENVSIKKVTIDTNSSAFFLGERLYSKINRVIDLETEEVQIAIETEEGHSISIGEEEEANLRRQSLSWQWFLPSEYELLKCEGFKSHYGILEGWQIKIKADLGSGKEDLDLIFDSQTGRVKGYLTSSSLVVVDYYKKDENSGVPVSFQTSTFQTSKEKQPIIIGSEEVTITIETE